MRHVQLTRIYLNLSTAEIGEAVERNRLDKEELKLLLAELRQRKSNAASKVEATARRYLAQIVLQNPAQVASKRLHPSALPLPLISHQARSDKVKKRARMAEKKLLR